MNAYDWIRCEGDDRARLVREAEVIARRLPPPSDGSLVALAFGHDRRAFAASLLACWLRGHGAAVVENALRERIMPVLEREGVVYLLHDTGSGRTLQVPSLLAAEEQPTSDAVAAAALPAQMLVLHAQTEDGDLHWCRWTPDELTAACDELAGLTPTRSDAAATPGLLASLFADTLAWLRGDAAFEPAPRRVSDLEVRGAPKVASRHRAQLTQLLERADIEDAAVVHDQQGRPRLALVGPGAAALAAATDGARAIDVIPRDPNGHPLRPELCLAVGLGRDGQAVSRDVRCELLSRTADRACVQVEIPPDYLFYEGHFDGYPVLAGGVQLHELVLPQLRALIGELPTLQKLDNVKFLARFVPGDVLELTLERQPDAHRATFAIQRGETRCTTGRLHFSEELAPLTTLGAER